MCNLGKHHWSVARLISLSKNFQVMDVPLDHLNIHYSYEFINLRDMVMHMNAVNNASLSFPIILDEDGELMDGRHRIMKALLVGAKTIKAVRFDKNPAPCRVSDD
jgi:hypothetical protein